MGEKTGVPTTGNVMGIAGKSLKYGIDYVFGTGQLRAGIRNATDGQYQTTSSGHTLSDWTHIVMVYESETSDGLRLYVDGDLKSSRTTIGLSDFASTDPFYIGSNLAYVGGSPKSFQGYIDDVKIYNRALTTSEIQSLYGRYDSKTIVE